MCEWEVREKLRQNKIHAVKYVKLSNMLAVRAAAATLLSTVVLQQLAISPSSHRRVPLVAPAMEQCRWSEGGIEEGEINVVRK